VARSDATRYLCAAAHLDGRFARRAIRLVTADMHQAVAPSPGMDTDTVLRHCFAAWRRHTMRDTLITVIVVPVPLIAIAFHNLVGLRDAAALVVVAGVVFLAERWISRYHVVARQLTRQAFDPAQAPKISAAENERLAQWRAAEGGNISIYGTYSPFVGSGFSQGGWSLVISLAKGKEPLGGPVRLDSNGARYRRAPDDGTADRKQAIGRRPVDS
jgi:hypothetical protein